MPRRHDLLLATFRAELKRLGFVFHPLTRTVSDLRHPGAYIDAIRAGRAINRIATISAAIAERANRIDAKAKTDAEQAARERFAATIAPQVFTPARDTLEGAAAIAALADDFIIMTTRSEGAQIGDLLRLGWRKAQIFEHADAARAVAAARQGGIAA